MIPAEAVVATSSEQLIGAGKMSDDYKRELANTEAIQRAQQVCADTLRDLPDDAELDVAFAEFKRRLRVTR